MLHFPVYLGWVHAAVKDAPDKAKPINDSQDLTPVVFAALDEIFQNGSPVLAVIDVCSTSCCSLGLESHRDGDTWAVRLLEVRDKGFALPVRNSLQEIRARKHLYPEMFSRR
jgi:hypothetical protein